MSAPRDCTVCTDPSPCQRHGLLRPAMGGGPVPSCEFARDKPAAFLYGIVIRLAEKQGVTVAELMDGGE